MSQADLDLAFTLCLLTGLGVFVCRLVLAMWAGRSLEAGAIAAALVVGVLAIEALPRASSAVGPVMVAGAAESRPLCTNTDPALVDVSGSRVRIAGHGPMGPDCGMWAVLIDRRTGRHWVQGPALPTARGWMLDLVLGTETPAAEPLSYEVVLLALDGDAHDRWLSAVRGGYSASLIETPPLGWLPPGFEVTVGG